MPSTPDLLGIPLELRQLIYTDLLPGPSNDCFGEHPVTHRIAARYWPLERPSDSDCLCHVWRNMAFSCRQLWHEIGEFWGRYTVSMDTSPRNKILSTRFQCLCGFTFFRPRIIVTIRLGTPDTPILPGHYSSLLTICRFLARIPSLPHVEIRLASDLYDPERRYATKMREEQAALTLVGLLTPFRLLAQNPVRSSDITLAGETIRDLWEEYNYLAVFANRIRQEMEGEEIPTTRSLELVTTLQSKIKTSPSPWGGRYGFLFILLGLYSTRVISRDRTAPRPELVCKTCGIELWYRDSMPRHLDLFHGGGRPTVTDGENGGKMMLRKRRRST